jgi:hypothetical protein
MKGNRVAVRRALMETAKRTQPPLLARLQQWQQEGKVQHFHSLWIVNAVSVRATPEVIESLKRDPLVEKVIQAVLFASLDLFAVRVGFAPDRLSHGVWRKFVFQKFGTPSASKGLM